MNTLKQTKDYDRGYEDAIEGRELRTRINYWYLKGYNAGLTFVKDMEDTQRETDAWNTSEAED